MNLFDLFSLCKWKAYFLLAEAAVKRDHADYKGALETLDRAAAVTPDDHRIYLERGMTYSIMQMPGHALKEIERSLILNPNNPQTIYLSLSLLFENEHNNEALAQSEVALKRFANDKLRLSIIHFIRSICFFRLSRMPDSLGAINRGLELNPNCDEFILHRANIFMSENRYPDAMQDYETALKLAKAAGSNGNLAGVQNTLAWILATCPDDTYRDGKRAVELAKQAFETRKNGPCAGTLAAAYAENGQFDEAIELAQKVLSTCPKEFEEKAQERLVLYQQGKPYRIPPGKMEMVKIWKLD